MTFVFYETCVPPILFVYAFFWPIIAVTCVSLVFFSFRTIAAMAVCTIAGSLGILFARAMSVKNRD